MVDYADAEQRVVDMLKDAIIQNVSTENASSIGAHAAIRVCFAFMLVAIFIVNAPLVSGVSLPWRLCLLAVSTLLLAIGAIGLVVANQQIRRGRDGSGEAGDVR